MHIDLGGEDSELESGGWKFRHSCDNDLVSPTDPWRELPPKIKNRMSMQSSSPASGNTPEGNENAMSKGFTQRHVHSSVIHNS